MTARALGEIAGKAIRSAAGRADSRAKMIGAVRAATRRLRLADDDRKAIQLEATGKASMADMSLAEIGLVLDRLNRDYRGPRGQRAHVGKIRALWWTLYWLGAVGEPNDAAVDAFVKRQTGKESARFLHPKEAFRVIEALKAWAAREGVLWPAEARQAELAQVAGLIDLPRLERHAVLEALARKLRDRSLLGISYAAYCARALILPVNHWAWDARQLDAAIRLLGKKLRRALDKTGGEE